MTAAMSGQVGPAVSSSSTPSRVASWARAYARLGWRVYPVERGGKRPVYGGWLTDATTDDGLIARWWPRDTGAPNIGVVAGESFDVFDIEAPHVEAFEAAAFAFFLSPWCCYWRLAAPQASRERVPLTKVRPLRR